ncbi:unnamed protein product, partial [marine sediment metagenome]
LTGLVEGTPIVGGGSDNAAGAVGSGIVRSGLISDSIGTSGEVFAHSDRPLYDPQGRVHSFCHATPGKWHLTGVTLSAAGSLKWYFDKFGPTKEIIKAFPDKEGYDLLNKQAERVPAGSDELIFLPYLSGERTPYADPYARGVFFGISYLHRPLLTIPEPTAPAALSLPPPTMGVPSTSPVRLEAFLLTFEDITSDSNTPGNRDFLISSPSRISFDQFLEDIFIRIVPEASDTSVA